MNDTIKEFLVGLGFDVDTEGLQKFTEGIKSASLRAAAFSAAMVAATAAIVEGIADVAKDYNELDQLAQKYNTTADKIDDFVDSAEMVGVGGDVAKSSLEAMNKVVGEAALGIGRGKIVLDKLGIAATDATGKVRPVTDVMGDLQTKLASMNRGQAMALMSKLGLDPKLLRMFNGELGNMQKIQKEMGDIDSSVGLNFDKTIQNSKKFTASMNGMKTQARLLHLWFQKVFESIASRLMPKVQEGIDNIAKVFEDVRHKFQANGLDIVGVLTSVFDKILTIGSAILQLAGRAISIFSSAISTAIGLIIDVNKETNGWAGYILAALAAWKLLNLGFLATPIGMIIGFGIALLGLYDDFMTWKEGGESLFDWTAWANGAQLIIDAFIGVKDVFGGVIEAVSGLVNMISSLFNIDVQGFTSGFLRMGTGVIMALQAIGTSVMSLIAGIGSLIATVLRLFGFDVNGFAKMFTGAFEAIVGVIDKVKNTLGGVVDKIASVGGKFSGAFDSVFGGSHSAPSPQARVAIAGGANVNQATNITVNGSTNPQATANAIAAKQKEVNSAMTRNVRGATR